MNNNQLYPFERNRYYAGKMLTSADFQAEQTYFNNKRRFVNNLMYGSGIVCGCGVFSLDDLSILVESGVAIDGLGREIVVDSSVVKKLSAVDGFEQLRTNRASLCLRYKENEVHAVYAVNQQESDREYEYNRISEGYQLFLMDTEDIPEEFEMETEFLTSGVLLNDDNFRVDLIMPATACKGKNIKVVLRVTKLSSENKKLSYHAQLQVPAFATRSGDHELEIGVEDVTLAEGEVLEREYWMTAQDTAALDTNVILKSGSVNAYVDDTAVACVTGFSLKILLASCKPRELVNREIGRMSLEMKNIGGTSDFIRLADLRLVRTDNAYIIEEVRETNIKKYITAPAQEMLRSNYMDYFVKETELGSGEQVVVAPQESEKQRAPRTNAPEVATGVLEIPLGDNARKGDIRYSGEIMHGLGKGNVYVEIGYEYISEDAALGANAKNTIYGNPDLFRDDANAAVDAETAVKVLNDKGSFVVGVKLLQNVDYLILSYRWVAIKFPAGNDLGLPENIEGKSISAETPTVVMGTKESHYFGVKFNNMDSSSLVYELTEPGSGEITADGIYTAPAKEGVYEVLIYCADYPSICTYAYAIVKKKGFDESEEV
ncbi:MAG: hypothetical protein SO019_09630 [Lachnospiraceae bacterium]|nr:hypothetical protein [Lachnospiraceae bacterium]